MDLLPLKVFYNTYSIYNILALFDVTSQVIATMDTNNEPTMFVHAGPDSDLKFYQCREWFYYFDTYAPNVLNLSTGDYSLLTTVQDNRKCFLEPKLKERMLPEFYNALLDSLTVWSLKA